MTLKPSYTGSLASLVVPANVSVNAIGFTGKSPLNVSGNLNIAGSVAALQTAVNTTSVLNLGNLNVQSGGLLTGYLPGYAAMLGNVFASSGLTLNVVQNVVNNGTITTPGTLNITAGGSIANHTDGIVQATMAAQNINLVAGSLSIVNSGLMQSAGSLSQQAQQIINTGQHI